MKKFLVASAIVALQSVSPSYAADVDGAWSAPLPVAGQSLYAMAKQNGGTLLVTLLDFWNQKMYAWTPLMGSFDGTTGTLTSVLSSQANGNQVKSLGGTFTLKSPTSGTFTVTSCVEYQGQQNCFPVGTVVNLSKIF